MPVDRTDGRRGITALVRELADGSATLVRDESTLARLEVAAAVRGVSVGSGLIAAGGVVTVIGLLSLFVGLILLIGDQWLPRDLYWVAALIVVVVSGGLALLFLRRGLSLLSPSALAPSETVETLKEDKEWLRRPKTFGATSS